MTNVEIALAYLEKGLSVIPLKSPEIVKRSPKFKEKVENAWKENDLKGNPRTKEEVYRELFYRECKLPIIPWKDFQKRRQTKEEVFHWFSMYHDPAIRIVTGVVSGLAVFDLDSPDAVKFAEEQGGFPDSVKVKTGKGYHVYMRHPGFEIRNSVNKRLDIDIRADGGYVVAGYTKLVGADYNEAWVLKMYYSVNLT